MGSAYSGFPGFGEEPQGLGLVSLYDGSREMDVTERLRSRAEGLCRGHSIEEGSRKVDLHSTVSFESPQ